jgi:hypothetical protein
MPTNAGNSITPTQNTFNFSMNISASANANEFIDWEAVQRQFESKMRESVKSLTR